MSSMNNILNPCDRVRINLCSTGVLDGFTNRLLIVWQSDVRSLCDSRVLIFCVSVCVKRSGGQTPKPKIMEFGMNIR